MERLFGIFAPAAQGSEYIPYDEENDDADDRNNKGSDGFRGNGRVVSRNRPGMPKEGMVVNFDAFDGHTARAETTLAAADDTWTDPLGQIRQVSMDLGRGGQPRAGPTMRK
jgi:hypothetical protein